MNSANPLFYQQETHTADSRRFLIVLQFETMLPAICRAKRFDLDALALCPDLSNLSPRPLRGRRWRRRKLSTNYYNQGGTVAPHFASNSVQ